jgi:hypothetical protein
LATKLVDDCEHAKWSTVEQLIVDEIHTPLREYERGEV